MIQLKSSSEKNTLASSGKKTVESEPRHSRLLLELGLLFIGIPLLLLLPIALWAKLLLGLAGICYCVIVSIKLSLFRRRSLFSLPSSDQWQPILLRFLIFAPALAVLMWRIQP